MEKSPFKVNQRSLSNKICNELSNSAIDVSGDVFIEPVSNTHVNEYLNSRIIPNIESHFEVKIVKTDVNIESYGVDAEPKHACESCVYSNGKWFRNKDIDFVTVVFLKQHLESVNEAIDTGFEVYGGKLEFPAFNFSFNPEMGTAVTYPAVPNFLNTISKVKIGQLDILRIFHRSDTMFVYEPSNYLGSPDKWFKDLT